MQDCLSLPIFLLQTQFFVQTQNSDLKGGLGLILEKSVVWEALCKEEEDLYIPAIFRASGN